MSQQSNETLSQNCISSSANTLCSMETVDVSDPAVHWDTDDHDTDDNNVDIKPWGRLLPVGENFSVLDLCNSQYIFGRGDDCDVTFSDPEGSRSNLSKYLVYSKLHFILTRENTSKGDHTFLEDSSSNGTFINGIKVGKRNKQVLNNNDEIALATKRNRVYVYLDLNATEDEQFPDEVRSRYTISRVIGRGACGEVRLAFTKGNCEKFAIKVISKRTFSMGGKTLINLSSSVMNEVNVLKALKHPCIIEVHDVIDTPETLYIILELVEGGDLFERVTSTNRLDESTAKLLFYQLVVSIKYLHEQGITHRDLKLENVLLSSEDTETLIKVTDFGLSKFMDANSLMKTFCGTPNYLAPEVLLTAGSGSYTQAIDCWSLGVILFMCLSGYPPFSEDKDLQLRQQIIKGRYSFPRDAWSAVSKDAIDLIKRFMTVDPKKRLTTEDALDHSWFKDQTILDKANNLMFPGSLNGVGRTKPKPKLKRQREESDETLDGDSDDGNSRTTVNVDVATSNKKIALEQDENPETSSSEEQRDLLHLEYQ